MLGSEIKASPWAGQSQGHGHRRRNTTECPMPYYVPGPGRAPTLKPGSAFAFPGALASRLLCAADVHTWMDK